MGRHYDKAGFCFQLAPNSSAVPAKGKGSVYRPDGFE
jgi:hypothetical protein